MKRIGEALHSMMPAFESMGSERRALSEALDQHLARDFLARHDAPAFSNSAMDGYAVRSADAVENGELKVIDESRAGGDVPNPLVPEAAMRIFTGAIVPEGADAVVIQEDVEAEGDRIRFRTTVPAGDNVRARGSDSKAGEVLLAKGTRLSPGALGLLASQGIAAVDVHRRPSVAIMTTGDELRELGEPVGPGSIYNSNAYALAAQVREAGGVPVIFPIVADSAEALEAALTEAIRHDLVITSGGVSVGEYDYVKPAFEAVGIEADFWKVAVKPGKPLTFGVAPGAVPVVGLPGNPISSMVTFEVFVRPGIRKMLGDPRPYRAPHEVRLKHPHKHSPRRPELARGTVAQTREGWALDLHRLQGSGSLPSMANVDALALLPAGEAEFESGRVLQAILLRDGTGHPHPPFDD